MIKRMTQAGVEQAMRLRNRSLTCVMQMVLLLSVSSAFLAGVEAQATDTERSSVVINAQAFADVVIQDDGRLKPMDTFARKVLLSISSKQRIDSDAAIDFLLGVLYGREQAMERKVFTIRSPAVVKAIGVEVAQDSRYSLAQLIDPMTDHEPFIRALQERDSELLDETERQLMQLYGQVAMYLSVTRSLSCFWPDIQIDDARLLEAFGGTAGSRYSYYFFVSQRSVLRKVLKEAAREKEKDADYDDKGMQNLWVQLADRVKHDSSEVLPLLPPLSTAHVAGHTHIAEVAQGAQDVQWRTAWGVLNEGEVSADDMKMMDALNDMFAATAIQDQAAFDQAAQSYKEHVGARPYIAMEVTYNTADLFYRSLYFYIASFIVLMVFWMLRGRRWYQASMALLACGGILHIVGVVMRCIIMSRPPVSTLYESVIFAGLIAVLFGFCIELWRRDTFALLSALIIGIVLQFISFTYTSEGDTMGMLQAVLNSTFWLATHVVTIMIGYGAALVAGIFGHVLLVRYIFCADKKKANQEILKTARGVALVALFFTTLGTILGGIWADQSWGRFWGWDPKENGALLIVLWLLIAVHGFISGEIKKIGFAAILALTNICVAIAWFGVNQLNVGLHSYGFDTGIIAALSWFCGGELVLVIGAALWATLLQRRPSLAQISDTTNVANTP